MHFFPMLYNLENKRVLLVGGGAIARHKLEKLLDFTESIVVVAKDLSDEMAALCQSYNLSTTLKPYESGDLAGFDIVIGAVDDLGLQKQIFEEARQAGVLCNCVDATEYCDFIFPSYFKRNELVVAVSSSGVTPSLAKGLREHFESLIPDEIDDFIETVSTIRNTMPKGPERQKQLIALSREFLKKHFSHSAKS